MSSRTSSGSTGRVVGRQLPGFLAAAFFSLVINLLMLTGPLYMMQVYDRVLGSRSVETLLVLSVLMVALFLVSGLLESLRAVIMGRLALRVQDTLAPLMFETALEEGGAREAQARAAVRDVDAVRTALASPAMTALFDLPFAPVFMAGVFILHPLLGLVATGGSIVIILLTWLNHVASRKREARATLAAERAERVSQSILEDADSVRALGMRDAARRLWEQERVTMLDGATSAGEVRGYYASLSKALRMILQSAMLGVGAWLVIHGDASGGVMIASSVLMGRALAPVDQVLAGWPAVQRAMTGARRIDVVLGARDASAPRTRLPRPRPILTVSGLSVAPPGGRTLTLRGVSFRMEGGHALAVIGPSGSGKSTLAKALAGAWKPAAGEIRLDGATLDQYEADQVGRLIGYLPQRISLVDGTVAQNIARLDAQPEDGAVVRAAKRAGAHEMILSLPEGYETRVTASGGGLSGGQLQRIGLARALYGDPVLMVLDEPDSNLDGHGSQALDQAVAAIKQSGGMAVVMAHRPSAIRQCDLALVIEGGAMRDFGPRDEVLARATTQAAPAVTGDRPKVIQGGVQ